MSLIKANWDAIKDEMRGILIQLARTENTICYSDLAAQIRTVYMHHRAPAFMHILREIAADDDRAGRPTLATLVVRKSDGRPGGGYFTMTDGEAIGEPEAYWQAQFRAVCDYWQNHDEEGGTT